MSVDNQSPVHATCIEAPAEAFSCSRRAFAQFSNLIRIAMRKLNELIVLAIWPLLTLSSSPAAAAGAYKFPEEMSFKTCFSSDRSATSRFRRAFSFSRSFIRRA